MFAPATRSRPTSTETMYTVMSSTRSHHDHGAEAVAENDHDEASGEHHHDEHDHGEHGAHDGHVWLDPANARQMVAEIARVLSEISPENASVSKRTPRARQPLSERSKRASPPSWRR